MSGIFRHSSFISSSPINEPTHNNNNSKRYAFSAFCTSPGTLRDVTMENSYGIGCRSPLQQHPGNSSPPTYSSHGARTVREFEEQMSNLRKENFNLKLRLYFIEESIPSYHSRQQHQQQHQNQNQQNHQQSPESGSSGDGCGHENIMKQLIDTKVEREVLRKELQEKQEILKEAAQAMTEMENIQKDTELRYNEMIEDLQQRIQHLEMERDVDNPLNPIKLNSAVMSDIMGHSDIGGNGVSINAVQKIRELEGLLKQSEVKLVELQSENLKLEGALSKRNETISEYEGKVQELTFKNSELLETIQNKEKEIVAAESEKLFWALQQHKVTLADKICLIDELEEKLKAKDVAEQEARRTIKELMKKIEEHQRERQQQEQQQEQNHLQQHEVQNCQNTSEPLLNAVANDEIVNLHSLSDSEALRLQLDSQTQNEKKKYETIIRKQDNTIKELKMEIKKKTGNLQNLVNKELWEKNREIERLTKIISKEMPLNEGSTTHSPNGSNGELHQQQQQSFSDVEYTKALERNKLLQRRVDVLLRRLDNEHSNEAIILQMRLELQKANEKVEQTEKWCRDCVEVCGGLTKRLEQLAGFLNTLLKHKDILHNLAADRRQAIRTAVKCSLDLSKSLNTTLSISGASGVSVNDESYLPELSNLSILLNEFDDEVDDFTQLDDQNANTIPMPIIESLQAENNALKKELDKRRCAENKRDRRSLPLTLLEQNRDSESEAWSEPDRNVSMARIGLEANKATNDRQMMPTILTNNNSQQHIETDSEQSEERSIINRLQNKVNRNLVSTTAIQERCQELEAMIALRNERILEIQCQLFDAEINLKEDKQHMEHFTKQIAQLQHYNTELEKKLNEATNVHNTDSLLIKTIEQAIAEKDKIIQKLNKEILKINEQYQREVEDNKSKHELNINNIKQELETLWSQRLEAQKKDHSESLKRDWIAREEHDQLQEQLRKLQSQHKEAQNNIEYLEENERELKQTLLESELRARQLQKTIDETTLQSSKIIMERTKALQENLMLEKEMKSLKQQLEKYATEGQQLQVTIKQLENELKTTTIIPSKIATAEKATQNMADDECISSQSGYNTSEELLTQKHVSAAATTTTLTARSMAGVLERLHNSSPDLGIESDAGRISSIEVANNSVQFNILKTIELKSNDNDFLPNHKKEFFKGIENNENIPPPPLTSSTGTVVKTTTDVSVAAATTTTTSPISATASMKIHDCAKVEQENAELRHKLIRTKRALEMTYEKLRHDNQRKAQIEKEIRNQINKTYNVLKTARNHIEKEFK